MQVAISRNLKKTIALLTPKVALFKQKKASAAAAAAAATSGGDGDVPTELYSIVGDDAAWGDDGGDYSFVGDLDDYPWDLRGKSREEWTAYLGTNNNPGFFALRDTDKAFCALTVVMKDKKDPKVVTHWSQLVMEKSNGLPLFFCHTIVCSTVSLIRVSSVHLEGGRWAVQHSTLGFQLPHKSRRLYDVTSW